MNKIMKLPWLLVLLLWGACYLSATAAESSFPFTFQVHDNGEVIVKDGYQEIVRVFPWIFTGNWIHHHWKGEFLFKATSNAEMEKGTSTVLLNKVHIDLEYSVECLNNGLRFHYRLEPRETIQVSDVEVYCRFPYPDWQGTSFEFNGTEGFIPIDAWKEKAPENNWLIRQADSVPLSLGPSRYHGGLTVQMVPENLYVLLADDRWYDPKLSIVLNHNDAPGFGNNPPPNWVWEKGQAKDFNFTLTFNRAMSCQPTPTRTLLPLTTPTPTPNDTFLTPNFSFASAINPTPASQSHTLPTPSPTRGPKAFPTFDFSFLTPNYFSTPSPTPSRRPVATPTFTSNPTPLSSINFPKEYPISKPFIPPPIALTPTDSRFKPVLWASHFPPSPTPSIIPNPPISFPTIAPTPVWFSLLDKQQSIEFSDPPANIYVVFGDGPGKYKVEVMNSSGKRLEVIYERKIAAQSDAWLEWDCLDGKGMPVPPGQYFVVVYKDGRILKSLSVVRAPKTPK